MPTPNTRVRSARTALTVAATLAAAGLAHAQGCPPVRFVSPDGADARHYGGPVAIEPTADGHRLAIAQTGSVWVYDLVDGQPSAGQEIVSPYPFMAFLFGCAVDLEGDRMAIGAYEVRWPGRPFHLRSVGGAAVFERNGDEWAHTGSLVAPLSVTAEAAVANPILHGDTIFGAGGGRIVVFEQDAASPDGWSPVQVIERPDGMAYDASFGYPVVPTGDWLFVGANREDVSGVSIGGSVVVYRRQPDGRYTQVQKIDGPDLGGYQIKLFGRSMDCDGRTLAIGSALASPDPDVEEQGAVYVLELDGDTWTPRQTLTHRGAERRDGLGGYAIRVDGDRLVAQASGDRTARSDNMAYLFERTGARSWRQSARLLPTPPYHAAQYASNLALEGDLLLVGSRDECEGPGTDTTGAAYLFDLACYECPDLDADDRLTVFDYLEFMRAFEAGEAIADMDNDGQLTVADFLAFQNAFAVGCP
ncbi:MAG: GC-type dockerin domain-anchored protein [Phycisphaerales bacterium]